MYRRAQPVSFGALVMANMMQVDVVDNAGPWLQWVLDTHAEWQRKAVKSTAWYAQQEIKKGIKSGAPGGRKYAEIMDPNRSHDIMAARKIGAVKARKLSKRGARHAARRGRRGALGRLASAVRYEYNNGSVPIGWLAEWAVRMGTRAEMGAREAVTQKMRGLFSGGAEGIKKSTTQINIPARPTFDPMFIFLAPKLGPYFVGKVEEYLANGGPPPKALR